jgi:hypothetical protein
MAQDVGPEFKTSVSQKQNKTVQHTGLADLLFLLKMGLTKAFHLEGTP